MSKKAYALLLLIIFVTSCPRPTPLDADFPTGEFVSRPFCIDFERTTREEAVNGAIAAVLYGDLGTIFPSNPVIFNNSALSDGAQSLFQGDPDSARPERSCGPLEIRIHPDQLAGKVQFEARNVGFISIPVEIVATAYGEQDGAEVEIDQYRKVSRSTLGDLRPVELATVESLDTGGVSEPPITKVVVEYGTCPPHVVIDNLCITPKKPFVGTIGQSDMGADRVVYYFDNMERKSYVQLANLSDSAVEVHVQVWIANSTRNPCEEIDFIDNYSARDVHTYDMSDLVGNDTIAPLEFAPDTMTNKYGFVVVTKTSGPPDSLVGVMRIIDDAGYEYRTNAVAPESVSTSTSMTGVINFNNIDGNSFSELIGFTYSELPLADTVYSDGGIVSVFGDFTNQILILDEHENASSCSPVAFSCNDGSTNIGIDNSLPNSKSPERRACITNVINTENNSGVLFMPFAGTTCTSPFAGDEDGNCLYDTHFVGFIGLNNGDGSGSFDSWWGGEINE